MPEAQLDVQLSTTARRLRGTQAWMRSLISAVEERISSVEAIWERAGRGDYLASIADASDTSPEATANRILGGITGYIYGAFRLTRPDMTAEDLDTFEREARKGFERGLAEAGDLLQSLGALSPQLEVDIAETADRVRSGLDAFFEAERERLFG